MAAEAQSKRDDDDKLLELRLAPTKFKGHEGWLAHFVFRKVGDDWKIIAFKMQPEEQKFMDESISHVKELAADTGLLPPDTHITRLPVEYARTFDAYATAVEAIKPTAAISFGLVSRPDPDKQSVIKIETVARNRDGANKPDNAGNQRAAEPILAAAPDTLAATFPASALVEALKEAGFNAELSDDAGRYLCNHLFYRALHAYSGRFPYGFVHVPPVDSMGGALSLQDLARAMAIMANTLDTQTA